MARPGSAVVLALLVALSGCAGVVPDWVPGVGGTDPVEAVTVDGSVAFGPVEVGTAERTTLTVENGGDEAVRVVAIRVVGRDAGAFAVVEEGGAFTLAPGARRQVTVRFAPASEGPKAATLRLQVGDPGANRSVEVALSGTGEPPERPELVLSADAVDFGGVFVGETGSATVTLRNDGAEPLTATGLRVAGDAAFDVVGGGFELVPGESRDVELEFAPASPGEHSATLIVDSDAPGAPHRVALTGRGRGRPELHVQPRSFDFGNVEVGRAATATVAVENTGNGTVTLSDARVEGGDGFFVREEPAGTLAPGERTTVRVAFVPAEPGRREATLVVETDAPDTPRLATTLTGNGVETDLSVSPGTLDFGTTAVGGTAALTLSVTNGGSEPVALSNVSLSGPDAVAFRVESGATGPIEPGETRNVTVAFRPARRGTHAAVLALSTDAEAVDSLDVPLFGSGAAPDVEVTPRAVQFESVLLGETARETVTVENAGNAALAVDTVTVVGEDPAAFRVAPTSPFELAPGEARNLTVAFEPTSGGARSAILRLEGNDPDDPQVNVWLTNTETVVRIDAGGGPNASRVDVAVEDAEANSTLALNVSHPGARGGDVSLDRLNLSLARGGDFSLNVTSAEAPTTGAPAFDPTERNNTAPVGYLNVTHSTTAEDVDGVTFTFRVSKERLEELDADPRDVALYRHVDGEWVELETSIRGETRNQYVLSATSPGLSDFVTGVKRPKFTVKNAAVSVSKIVAGENVTVEVTIRNVGGADGSFTTRLLLNGEVVEQRDVTVGAESVRVVTFRRAITEPGEYTVTVNDVVAGRVEVDPAEVEGPVGSPGVPWLLVGAGLLVVLALALRRWRSGSGGSREPEGSVDPHDLPTDEDDLGLDEAAIGGDGSDEGAVDGDDDRRE